MALALVSGARVVFAVGSGPYCSAGIIIGGGCTAYETVRRGAEPAEVGLLTMAAMLAGVAIGPYILFPFIGAKLAMQKRDKETAKYNAQHPEAAPRNQKN